MKLSLLHAAAVSSALFFGVTGCASRTTAAPPNHMSAAQYEAAAKREQGAVEIHSAQFDPNANERVEKCGRTGGDAVCWTSVRNPTSHHLADARQHQKTANEHRAMSRALRDAEARACSGLSEEDRTMSPFEHREDIASIETVDNGANVTFRPVPGLTADGLQRLVDCHLARADAAGHDMPEMPTCPLVPRNATAKVTSSRDGLTVAVRSDDRDAAREIVRRVRALIER